MQMTILAHFYNEEFLIPFWIEHHKSIFDHGILINHGSTDSSVELIKKHAPTWTIVDSKTKSFDARQTDEEVMAYEQTVMGGKIALNLTEFLFGLDLRERLRNNASLGFVTTGVWMIDPSESSAPDASQPLIQSQHFGSLESEISQHYSLPSCRNRILHRAPHGMYTTGRHGSAIFKFAPTPDIFTLWFRFSPWNEKMLARGLQIQARMPSVTARALGEYGDTTRLDQLVVKYRHAGHYFTADETERFRRHLITRFSRDLLTNKDFARVHEGFWTQDRGRKGVHSPDLWQASKSADTLTDLLQALDEQRPAVEFVFNPQKLIEAGRSPLEVMAAIERYRYIPFHWNIDAPYPGGCFLQGIEMDAFYAFMQSARSSGMEARLILISAYALDRTSSLTEQTLSNSRELRNGGNFDAAEQLLHQVLDQVIVGTRPHSEILHELTWFKFRRGEFRSAMKHFRIGRHLNTWGSYCDTHTSEMLPSHTDLKNKVVLVQGEGGFGDEIQHIRFAKTLKDRGAEVIWSTDGPLQSLLSRSQDIEQVVGPLNTATLEYDYWAPCTDLPAILELDADQLPQAPYLTADSGLVRSWSTLLPDVGRPKVGLKWSGNPKYEAHLKRSISIDQLQPLLKGTPAAAFYSLQKHDEGATLSLPKEITDLGSKLETWEQTAAAIENLDLIITTCTSIAHLAAALGKPTWLLCTLNCAHAWALPGEKTPWYAQMRIFRQTEPNKWDDVVKTVKRELEQWTRP